MSSTFLAQYRQLPAKADKLIRFFDRKGFYNVYGDDAVFVAKTYNRTTATVRYIGEEGQLASQSVQARQLPTILKHLVEKLQYSFEIWASQSRSGWECTQRGSPGNFETFDMDDTNVEANLMMAAKASTKGGALTIGVAYVDALTGLLGVCEFEDDDRLSNLESCIVQLGAKECLMHVDNVSIPAKTVRSMFLRCDVVLTERKKKEFRINDVEQDLRRLLNDELHPSMALPELDLVNAMGALAALIAAQELISDVTHHNRFRLLRFDLTQFMRLDAAAVQAMNLVPTASDGNKHMNLFGRLNKCKTAMGSRLLMSWIKQPLMNVDHIRQRQDLVSVFVNDIVLRQTLQSDFLSMVPDLNRLGKKFQRKKANLADCVRLYQFVQTVPKLLLIIHECEHAVLKHKWEQSLKQAVLDFDNFENMIESTIDLQRVKEHEYHIQPSFDENLTILAQSMDRTMRKMRAEHTHMDTVLGLKKFELEEKKGHGWCFRTTKREERAVKAKLKRAEFESVATVKGGWFFRTARLRTLSESYGELRSEYESTQSQLVRDLLEVVEGYTPVVDDVAAIVSELDVFVSLADVASLAPKAYVKPTLTPAGEGDTVLRQARHPCLEVQDEVNYIANDVELRRGSKEFVLITGPNMGGKSTYIRAAAMIVLMAQIGSFVPCEDANVCVVDCILARVGAGDSQLRGISTFMAEMLETAAILKTATPKSLLIIDELGRGTSTYDGFGLAWAISEFIARELRSFCFFATHFHELTELEKSIDWVTNLHVTAHTQGGQLTLLYQLQPGPCDQSFGIHVAELADFPPEVVALAKRKARELENFDREAPTALKKLRAGHGDAAAASDPEAQAKVEQEAAGMAVLRDFVASFKQLPLNEMTDDEAVTKVQELTRGLESHPNPYVQRMLERGLTA